MLGATRVLQLMRGSQRASPTALCFAKHDPAASAGFVAALGGGCGYDSDGEPVDTPAVLGSRVYGPLVAAWASASDVEPLAPTTIAEAEASLPPPITAEELHTAATSVSAKSAAQAVWHPRRYGHLGPAPSRAVLLLLRATEVCGRLPMHLRRVRPPTLLQLDGPTQRTKARAIGHVGSLVRVFTRARRAG